MIDRAHPPPALVRDCIHAFEVLRCMGFAADDIFCGVQNVIGEGVAAVVVLRPAAGPEWVWVIGRLQEQTPDAFYALWREAAVAWNASGGGVDLWGFRASRIRGMCSEVIASLLLKGIAIPGEARI